MTTSTKKFLLSILLVASTMGSARADTVNSSGVTVSFNGYGLTPLSQQGNAFTFQYPYLEVYQPQHSIIFIDKQFFSFTADPGYSLTGKMRVQIDGTFHTDGDPEFATLGVSFNVLIPLCDSCSPSYATHLSSAAAGAASPEGLTGSVHVDTGYTAASGLYKTLQIDMYDLPGLSQYAGEFAYDTITVTAETVQTSPVPELPTAAMLSLGLALLGASLRVKRAKRHPLNYADGH